MSPTVRGLAPTSDVAIDDPKMTKTKSCKYTQCVCVCIGVCACACASVAK